MASTLPGPIDYVCINCCEPGAVGEIHIYSADNEFERSLTILDALGEIFTSSNLIVAQEARITVFMCSKCAEAISYMYQYYNNLLQLSVSNGYICKLISQIETWHHHQSHQGKVEFHAAPTGTGETEFLGFTTTGEEEEGSYDFPPLETTEEQTVYDTRKFSSCDSSETTSFNVNVVPFLGSDNGRSCDYKAESGQT